MMKKKMRRQSGGGVSSMPLRKKMKRRGIVRSVLPDKNLSFLPEEIISNDILPKLPVKSIARFKSVSKTWSSLFSDPYFIKLHKNHAVQQDKFSLILNDPKNKRIYSIDFDSLAASQKPLHITDYPFVSHQSSSGGLLFVGSCNGLVCFTYHPHVSINRIYLWNPSTDECRLVPPPPRPPILNALESFEILTVGLGFGYDFKLDTYKIFMVSSVRSDHPDSFFIIVRSYTLVSDSWKISNDKIPYKIPGNKAGKFVNGSLHWMGTRLTPNKIEYHVILSFNVGDERFKELSIPKSLNDKGTTKFSTFGVLRENLCVFDNWVTHSDVWVMKEYGVSESWTKLFAIPKYNPIPTSVCIMKLINSFENGDILLWKGADDILLYDKEKKTTIRKLSKVRDAVVMSCVGSLVSLNSKIYLKQQLLGDNSIQIPTPCNFISL